MEQWLKNLHKSNSNFGNKTRESKIEAFQENRRDKRHSRFNNLRQLGENNDEDERINVKDTKKTVKSPKIKPNKRLEMLAKWKEEKEKRKNEAKKTIKPIFKVTRVEPDKDLNVVMNYIKGKKIKKESTNVIKINDKSTTAIKTVPKVHRLDKKQETSKVVTRRNLDLQPRNPRTGTIPKIPRKTSNIKRRSKSLDNSSVRKKEATKKSIGKQIKLPSSPTLLAPTNVVDFRSNSIVNSKKSRNSRNSTVDSPQFTNMETNFSLSPIVSIDETEKSSKKNRKSKNSKISSRFSVKGRNSSITTANCSSSPIPTNSNSTNSSRNEEPSCSKVKTPKISLKNTTLPFSPIKDSSFVVKSSRKSRKIDKMEGETISITDTRFMDTTVDFNSSRKSRRGKIVRMEEEPSTSKLSPKNTTLTLSPALDSSRKSRRSKIEILEEEPSTSKLKAPKNTTLTLSPALDSSRKSRRSKIEEMEVDIPSIVITDTTFTSFDVKSRKSKSNDLNSTFTTNETSQTEKKSSKKGKMTKNYKVTPYFKKVTKKSINLIDFDSDSSDLKKNSPMSPLLLNSSRNNDLKTSRRSLKFSNSCTTPDKENLEINLNETYTTPSDKKRKSIRRSKTVETEVTLGRKASNKTPLKSRSEGSEYYTPSKELEDEVFTTPQVEDKPIVYVSPFVTMSRGKQAARKEYLNRKSDTNIPRSPKTAALYFTNVLNNEILKIQEMCQKWQQYKNEENPSEDACGMIDMTIGQSNLLITKKFNQFRKLIEQCKNSTGEELLITCEDLHGFWDMIYKQVNDLNKRFENLDDMKKNNWFENVQNKEMPKKKTGKKKKNKSKATSSLREKILEARKKKAELGVNNELEIEVSTPGRGILKIDNTKSDKKKSVVFRDSGRHVLQENVMNKSGRSTPLLRRSGRLSMVNKLEFD